MSKFCTTCLIKDAIIEKRDREIRSLKDRLKLTPIQEMKNLRAEIQELKGIAERTHQRVCNPMQDTKNAK